MRQTLQYIYILLKNLPLNVTVTSGWLDNYWIHLFGLDFFFTHLVTFISHGAWEASLAFHALQEARTNDGGGSECFSPDLKRPKTNG